MWTLFISQAEERFRGEYSSHLTKVGQCKLDPGLKAPGFKVLIVTNDNSAFNLNPFCCLFYLSSRHYTEALQWGEDNQRALQQTVRRCRLTSG